MSDELRIALGMLQCVVVFGLPLFGLLCAMDIADRQAEAKRRFRRH